MDKQAAINFIQQGLNQNRPQSEIVEDLCRQLNAPADKVSAFVAKVATQSKPIYTASYPESVQESDDTDVLAGKIGSNSYIESLVSIQPTTQTASIQGNPEYGSANFYQSVSEPEINQEELEALILKLLRKDQRRSDVVLEVCERTGMDWNHAQRLVAQTSTKHNKHLVTRQNMIIIPLATLALLAGLGLLGASVSEGLEIARQVNEAPSQIAYQTSEIEFILREGIWGFVIGISLFLGGTYGLIRALQSQLD